jgi:hypothetical protein
MRAIAGCPASAPKATAGIRGGRGDRSRIRSASGSAAHRKKTLLLPLRWRAGESFRLRWGCRSRRGFGAAAAFGFDGVGAHAVRAKDAAEVAASWVEVVSAARVAGGWAWDAPSVTVAQAVKGRSAGLSDMGVKHHPLLNLLISTVVLIGWLAVRHSR